MIYDLDLAEIFEFPQLQGFRINDISIEEEKIILRMDSVSCDNSSKKNIKALLQFQYCEDTDYDIQFSTYNVQHDALINGVKYYGREFQEQFFKDNMMIEIIDILCRDSLSVQINGRLIVDGELRNHNIIQIVVYAKEMSYEIE